ncbi:MAG: CHRD domain-containing protein [Flavisolibacter sp.]
MNAIINYKKKNMKMTKIYLFSASIISIFVLSLVIGCSKDNNNNNTPADVIYTISATMNGANEKPNAITTSGTGTTTGTYNQTTKELKYSVAWSGLTGTATVGHFHGPAAATATASPIIYFNLVNNGTSGTANGTITLTAAQEADLLAGLWYSNIHTATNGGGEIRGQVSATK